MKPAHILDDNLTNISFAMSMRILESDYNGPLIRLRRASDNAEQDFYSSSNDIVDINAINTWRTGSNVFVHTWYDQSGLSRDAIQTTINRQPQFFPDLTRPYFVGDGSNDYLTIDTPNGIQDVTNAGNEGTVLVIARASSKNQHTFGVLTGNDRWSSHMNWVNSNLYFDPGMCCNSPRNFSNGANFGIWEIYTFIKTSTNSIVRSGGVDRFNGTHTTGRCTRTEDFAIGWATGDGTNSYSTTAFEEMVMYNTNIAISLYQEIEDNATLFWSL